ncbi:MAG TPA: hypothetical protein VHQ86_04645 [Candidatus Saccharimonadia bacterium]|jgi:20S proteasome alpha/beta subunit|nr:hypothetical protein [Candidatus Saccharimonadia bacterium]
MSLVLALKNRNSIVVAGDTAKPSDGRFEYGSFMNMPGRTALLVAGNMEAVRRPIMDSVLPKVTVETSAAALAQLVQAALVLEVVPRLAEVAGRVEIIVAGIDPVRHIEEPGIYYMDSASDFYLTIVRENYAAAGATALVKQVVGARDLSACTTDQLTEVAKECLATTKLHWPGALGAHQRLGIITFQQTKFLDF